MYNLIMVSITALHINTKCLLFIKLNIQTFYSIYNLFKKNYKECMSDNFLNKHYIMLS